jgi:hypothetical protein
MERQGPEHSPFQPWGYPILHAHVEEFDTKGAPHTRFPALRGIRATVTTMNATVVILYDASIKATTSADDLFSNRFDWGTVQAWLRTCESKHGRACETQGRDQLSVPGFKVIDCKTRTIVPALAKCQYTALSYVWGQETDTWIPSGPHLQHRAHLIVEDAIICTQNMGFRYLWIDRYCIDQNDPNTKHILIQHMDDIYRNASIAIINAAGTGPKQDYPACRLCSGAALPSLSLTGRPSFRCLKPRENCKKATGQPEAVGSPVYLQYHLLELISRLHTGTYQEGLLAPSDSYSFHRNATFGAQEYMHARRAASCEHFDVEDTRVLTHTANSDLGPQL